jgi:hypothetical protein
MRRQAHVTGWVILVLVSTLLLATCYQPRLASCTVACDQQHGCPSPLECVAGFCTSGGACIDASSGDVSPDALDALADEGATGPSCNRADASTAPDSPPADNLVVWLASDSVDTTGPTFVWSDRSGNGNHATASGQASPTFVPGAGGLPGGVEFSGNGQYLTLPASLPDFHQGIAIFLVIEPRAAPPSADAYRVSFVDFAQTAGTDSTSIIFGQDNLEAGTDGDTIATFETWGARNLQPGVITDDSRQLLEVVASSTPAPGFSASAIYKNGVWIGGSSWMALPTAGWSSNLIGRSNLASQPGHPDFRGTISELLIYEGLLNPPNRQQVESYLMARWCLP